MSAASPAMESPAMRGLNPPDSGTDSNCASAMLESESSLVVKSVLTVFGALGSSFFSLLSALLSLGFAAGSVLSFEPPVMKLSGAFRYPTQVDTFFSTMSILSSRQSAQSAVLRLLGVCGWLSPVGLADSA